MNSSYKNSPELLPKCQHFLGNITKARDLQSSKEQVIVENHTFRHVSSPKQVGEKPVAFMFTRFAGVRRVVTSVLALIFSKVVLNGNFGMKLLNHQLLFRKSLREETTTGVF